MRLTASPPTLRPPPLTRPMGGSGCVGLTFGDPTHRPVLVVAAVWLLLLPDVFLSVACKAPAQNGKASRCDTHVRPVGNKCGRSGWPSAFLGCSQRASRLWHRSSRGREQLVKHHSDRFLGSSRIFGRMLFAISQRPLRDNVLPAHQAHCRDYTSINVSRPLLPGFAAKVRKSGNNVTTLKGEK